MQLSLDPIGYTQKPTKKQVFEISGRIANHVVDFSIETLAQAIESGQTYCGTIFKICPQLAKRRRIEALFEFSEILSLDFDLGVLPEFKIPPGILYKSFSYTENKPKFRAVWRLNEKITDLARYKVLYKSFANEVGYTDPACSDAARLFFGSHPSSVIELNPELILDVSTISQPKINKSTKSTIWADGETEAEQRDILFKLKPVHRRWLVGFVRDELNKLKIFDGSSGSRYQTLWSTTANLACTPELLPDVVGLWVAEAVEANSYYADWDKNIEDTVFSAIEWAKLKRSQ